jgi:hypothetical protein
MATHADADLILRLYDLRRENVLRAARAWMIAWQPASADEAKVVATDMSRQDNAYLRQVTSYWEMAYSIANQGAIDETLFAKNAGEGVLLAVKCQILKAKFPEVWTRSMPEVEAFIARSPIAQQKAEIFRKRFA